MTLTFNKHFLQGYSELSVYDGEYIAGNTGTIVVTINYRLGALGFLAYGKDIEGNFGFQVSVAKLRLLFYIYRSTQVIVAC